MDWEALRVGGPWRVDGMAAHDVSVCHRRVNVAVRDGPEGRLSLGRLAHRSTPPNEVICSSDARVHRR
jgi:hypothetical protein